ncbi:MAG: NYN domain-containing protein, partial [Devosia sp.]|nr:NYN domain-containing protein [Devosia sp.]
MDRVAVFVDAGYLFAQGSTALTGSKKARTALVINAPKAIEALKQVAASRAPVCSLLRIYWYDGAIGGPRPTTDQALLANLDDVKLRLGFVNSHGEQKGVDSLIVTDLIELARLKSVSDAVLLSGDEDVRVGVQIAQNYGVR